MPKIIERVRKGWNAFLNNKDPTENEHGAFAEVGYSYRPDRVRMTYGNERSIVMAIYNRIAVDVAAIPLHHVRVDENGRFKECMNSGLERCLSLNANVDQTGRDFIYDAVVSMLDEGCIGIVPVDTTFNPYKGSYEIDSLRVAKILEWYPSTIKIRAYNEQTGRKEDIVLPKGMVAIVENPFYQTMNEPLATLKRLIRKLNLLDFVDEQTSSGKLDLIIQLPYVVKTETKRKEAEKRRKDIEMQLAGTKYGIAYTDGTERITQLNRPAENNLLNQVKYLTEMLYSQLGITDEIMNGTADENTMLNYYNRTIEPIISAIAMAMKWKFLTSTARTQGQSIEFYRDPFRLVPINNIADIADKFTRNEILSSNEIRTIIGMRPSGDPKADELRNKNLNPSTEEAGTDAVSDVFNDEPATPADTPISDFRG